MENRPESAVSHGRSLQPKARLPKVQSLIGRATACDTVRVAPAHEGAVRRQLPAAAGVPTALGIRRGDRGAGHSALSTSPSRPWAISGSCA